jgi:hypothetical protein
VVQAGVEPVEPTPGGPVATPTVEPGEPTPTSVPSDTPAPTATQRPTPTATPTEAVTSDWRLYLPFLRNEAGG